MPPSVSTPSKSSSRSLILRMRCRTEAAERGTRLDAGFQQIVKVDHAHGFFAVQDEERSDRMLFHDAHRGRCERVAADRLGIPRHQIFRLVAEDLTLAFETAAQVAVGDDADELPLTVD